MCSRYVQEKLSSEIAVKEEYRYGGNDPSLKMGGGMEIAVPFKVCLI